MIKAKITKHFTKEKVTSVPYVQNRHKCLKWT